MAGSAAAAHALGRYHRERGDEPAAEYWLRQSAEQGHALGAYALADLLEHRGDSAAEQWMRSAAERGHREAAYRLARALDRRVPHEDEREYDGGDRRGVGDARGVGDGRGAGGDNGVASAPGTSGVPGVPGASGSPGDEAEQWYRQAAARGHQRAALQLGAILEKRGELKEAGRWYLTSAKDGEARAACALGFLLRDAA